MTKGGNDLWQIWLIAPGAKMPRGWNDMGWIWTEGKTSWGENDPWRTWPRERRGGARLNREQNNLGSLGTSSWFAILATKGRFAIFGRFGILATSGWFLSRSGRFAILVTNGGFSILTTSGRFVILTNSGRFVILATSGWFAFLAKAIFISSDWPLWLLLFGLYNTEWKSTLC